jgi:hypothetical protein
MRLFSQIDTSTTSRDETIRSFISETGLPEDTVNRLYESGQIPNILKSLNEASPFMDEDMANMFRNGNFNGGGNGFNGMGGKKKDWYTEKDQETGKPKYIKDNTVMGNLGTIVHGISLKDPNDPRVVRSPLPSNMRANVDYTLSKKPEEYGFGDYALIAAAVVEDFPVSQWTDKLAKIMSVITDAATFFKMVMYICFLKNKDKFIELNPSIAKEFYPEIMDDISDVANRYGTNMNESSKLYNTGSVINTVNDNSQPWKTSIKEDIHLYGTLKELLAKNNHSWGNNYHLDNVYDAIWNYLDNEIEALTNQNNVVEINDEFHEKFVIDLIFHSINPMYKNVSVLKTLIPDIQTLVFDMILLTTEFVKQHQTELSYLNQDIWDEYFASTTNMIQNIYSSRLRSKLIDVKQREENAKKLERDGAYEKSRFLQENFMFTDEFTITAVPMYNHQLKIENIIDCIYIVKSCQNEFNLKIRKILNIWITKAFEIVTRGEKIILEHNRISRYKN